MLFKVFQLESSFTFKTTPRVRERMRTSRFVLDDVTCRAVLRAGVFHRCKKKKKLVEKNERVLSGRLMFVSGV